jgi:arsenate reductase
MKTVMFACKDNASLSPMAAVFFNSLVNRESARGVSAGLEFAERIQHGVVQAMRELNIDLSRSGPRLLTPEAMESTIWVVTLGAERNYPIPPELQHEHWPLEECQGKSIEQVRQIRNSVEKLVRQFVARKGWMKSTIRRTAEWSPTGLSG